jgi:hypothetical protein
MKNLRLRPVVLSAVTYEDIQKRAESVPQKEIRKRGIARMLREADVQGGTLAKSDISLILSCSNMTIYKNITEYERENNVVLPRRGTVHDLGRSTTHKKSSAANQFRIEKLRRTSQGKLITVPTPSIGISAISTVCVSALRKDCRWKRPHSQRS